MKRFFTLLAFFLSVSAITSGQVINFSKTLPVGAYSIGIAPVYNAYKLGASTKGPISALLYAGIGLRYDVDMNLKYGYYDGADYFGVDVQYLFRETRKSYYSLFGGIHKWDEYGIDATISYTYAPQFWLNFSVGLDIDADFTDRLDIRANIPLNVGINAGDRLFIFAEYNLPANEKAWDIFALGLNLIIR